MNEIVAIVEGETEEDFVRDVLASHLAMLGSNIWSRTSGKKRKRGGVKRWEATRADIIRTLKEGRYCTTMFDFYALPRDWPGREAAAKMGWNLRGQHVEQNLRQDIAAAMGAQFNPRQFIPYIQVHEFEALLFANIEVTVEFCATIDKSLLNQLRRKSSLRVILDEAGDPEAINDNYETCPSRQIQHLVKDYRKRVHGPIIAQRIGLETLRAKCRHFSEWIEKLEQIGRPAT
jgi:hypothetical protein